MSELPRRFGGKKLLAQKSPLDKMKKLWGSSQNKKRNNGNNGREVQGDRSNN